MVKVLNTEKEDYHVHSLNFSDGMNTVDEVVKFAGEIGMKKIVFTDHSQALLDANGLAKKGMRGVAKLWKNVHNDVEVIFGVEADLLNEKGDICAQIQGIQGDFIILSFHKESFSGDAKRLTEAYINAIKRHHEMIDCIGHLDVNCENVDVKKVVEAANEFDIPLELNCKCFSLGINDMKALRIMLENAKSIYVNSDSHRLWDLKEFRKIGFKFLEENGFI